MLLVKPPEYEVVRAANAGEKVGLKERAMLGVFRHFFRGKLRKVFELGGGDDLGDAIYRKAYFEGLRADLEQLSDPKNLSYSMWDSRVIAGGIAIPSGFAADCLTDAERSMNFMNGLKEAIDTLRARFQRKIKVLYAGTGPFASLALPVMAALKPEDVAFDLVDINEESASNVRRIIDLLGFQDYVGKIVAGDATELNFSSRYDMAVAEVMGPALSYEPQLAVMAAVKKALYSEGMLLPELIKLGLMLGPVGDSDEVIEGDFSWRYEAEDEDNCPKMIEVEMDVAGVKPGLYVVGIKTEVGVYGSNVVKSGKAVITGGITAGVCEITEGASKLVVSYPPGADLVYGTYQPKIRVE